MYQAAGIISSALDCETAHSDYTLHDGTHTLPGNLKTPVPTFLFYIHIREIETIRLGNNLPITLFHQSAGEQAARDLKSWANNPSGLARSIPAKQCVQPISPLLGIAVKADLTDDGLGCLSMQKSFPYHSYICQLKQIFI